MNESNNINDNKIVTITVKPATKRKIENLAQRYGSAVRHDTMNKVFVDFIKNLHKEDDFKIFVKDFLDLETIENKPGKTVRNYNFNIAMTLYNEFLLKMKEMGYKKLSPFCRALVDYVYNRDFVKLDINHVNTIKKLLKNEDYEVTMVRLIDEELAFKVDIVKKEIALREEKMASMDLEDFVRKNKDKIKDILKKSKN